MTLQMTPLVSVKALRTNPKCRARHVTYNVDVESHDRKQGTHNENISGCCPKMFH